MNYIQKVHELVKKIPKGKVTTYGAISSSLSSPRINRGSSSRRITPRMVGWALHQNKSSDVPCHRVVNREGRLAPNFAFDGWQEQKRRLTAEGVNFRDEMHVELKNFLWKGFCI